MEKFIYWIKRTLHHSKHCNSLCMLCKYYDEKIFKKQLTYMHNGCIVSTVNRS